MSPKSLCSEELEGADSFPQVSVTYVIYLRHGVRCVFISLPKGSNLM